MPPPVKSFPPLAKTVALIFAKALAASLRPLSSIYLTSPPVIYKNLFIVGGRNPETLPAPPGNIRAFDVRTGAPRWSFHTIPHPGEFGYETWPPDAWKSSGAANNWAGMSLDSKRGILFVPTGSAAFDFYGGDRLGDNLFANCLIALNAETGERIWHFQGVKHDIWDRDFPSHPALLTVTATARKSTRSRKPPNRGSFISLIELPARLCFLSNLARTLPVICPVKLPRHNNPCQPNPRPSLVRNLQKICSPIGLPPCINGLWKGFTNSAMAASSFHSLLAKTPLFFLDSMVVRSGAVLQSILKLLSSISTPMTCRGPDHSPIRPTLAAFTPFI